MRMYLCIHIMWLSVDIWNMSILEFLWHVKALNKKYVLCNSVLVSVLERFIGTWYYVVQLSIYLFIEGEVRGQLNFEWWLILSFVLLLQFFLFLTFKNIYKLMCSKQKLLDNSEVYRTPQNYGSLVWNLLELTLLVCRVWRCLLDFWKILGSLCWSMQLGPICGCVYCIFIVRIWLSIHFFPPNNQLKYLLTFSAVAAVQNFWTVYYQ